MLLLIVRKLIRNRVFSLLRASFLLTECFLIRKRGEGKGYALSSTILDFSIVYKCSFSTKPFNEGF
jgi:hypothetical protein